MTGKYNHNKYIAWVLNLDSGHVSINGIDMTANFNEVRKHIGYIPENVNLYPYLTGVENLDYFCKLSGNNYSSQKLEELLGQCGLNNDSYHKRTKVYSKGMRQKVGIAIALAKNAKVYLLDEPASGLDPLASNELSGLLRKLSSEGAAVLMASHDILESERHVIALEF